MIRLQVLVIPLLAGALTVSAVAPAPAAAPLESASPAAPAYVAVIDGGSSGTRLALFAKGTGVTVRKVYNAPAASPGLSSFAAKPAAAGPEAVEPLLAQLDAYLEGRAIAASDVSIALLATAGMRRLRLDDPAAVRKIFASTRASIDSFGFTLRANKILPDVKEASLAWLDANAGARTLRKPKKDIGIVEVGGASAQIAFRSQGKSGPGVVTVRVGGKRIGVVAVSILGMGSNEARGLMQAANAGGAFCFPNNPSGTDPAAYLATSSMPVPSAGAKFLLADCGQAYTSTIIDVTSETPRALRPRNLSEQPGFSRSRFVGLGGVPFVYGDFKISRRADERRGLRDALRATCKGTDAWAKVGRLFPDSATTFAEVQCSSGAYLNQMFFGPAGIGLDPQRFQAQPDLPGGEPSWPEGYAIAALHP